MPDKIDLNKKQDLLIFISRIERDNRIEIPIKVAHISSMSLSIIGTNKDVNYKNELKNFTNDKIKYLGEINEDKKNQNVAYKSNF